MELIPIYYRQFSANTYLVGDKGSAVFVIDPGMDSPQLIETLKRDYAKVSAVLLTHGHFDHIRGVDMVVNAFHCPVYIHEADARFLMDTRLNGSGFYARDAKIHADPVTFSDDEVLVIDGVTIRTIATPFHTKGSVCFLFEAVPALFSGDTLFRGDIGRTDLPTGSERSVESSLNKLRDLPDELPVYSGHGHPTTIGRERLYNRHFRQHPLHV